MEDGRVLKAVEHAVAASRWRIAARFEGPQGRAQFMRQAEVRHAAATECLNEIAKTGPGGEPRTGLRLADDGTGGLCSRRRRS